MDFDDPNTWRWIWLVAMATFGIGEMAAAGSFFLAPFALGAGVAAVLAFLGVPVGVEWVVFIGVSTLSFLALRPLARRLDRHDVAAGIGANRLVGQIAEVMATIEGGQAPGMVLLGGEQWRAESDDGRRIDVGTRVAIAEVRGTRVVVRAIDATEPRSVQDRSASGGTDVSG